MNIFKYKNKKNKSGFISMFAIFFSAIIVSVLTALYVLLLKQIELLSIDYNSFQALYTSDSAFECVLYKEQNTTSSTTSIFLQSGSLGYCITSGDAQWASQPVTTAGRSNSVLNISLDTQQGNFCGVITAGKQVDNSEVSNHLTISGQSRDCTASSTKVVERVIDFYY